MTVHSAARRLAPLAAGLALTAALTAGCRQDMHDQPKELPYQEATFFADHRAVRPQVAGTVARGRLQEDAHFHRGKVGDQPAETFPAALAGTLADRALASAFLDRGRERYDIHCAPCHSRTGDGDGMVVRRGMRRPPSMHIERLQTAPPGYFYDVITNGFGAMFDLSDRVEPRDRWAIVAWIRVLQQSQSATLAQMTPKERETLDGLPPPGTPR